MSKFLYNNIKFILINFSLISLILGLGTGRNILSLGGRENNLIGTLYF